MIASQYLFNIAKKFNIAEPSNVELGKLIVRIIHVAGVVAWCYLVARIAYMIGARS